MVSAYRRTVKAETFKHDAGYPLVSWFSRRAYEPNDLKSLEITALGLASRNYSKRRMIFWIKKE